MPAPDRRPPPPSGTPEDRDLSPEEQGRMLRAALLRPMSLMVLVIGAVFFAATTALWVPLLTLATYATLVFLGTRDPVLRQRTLGPEKAPLPPSGDDVSPERRARWLPRGETRDRVEAALVEYRKVIAAIEDSDEVTRAVLDDALPRLHAAADRLVDVGRNREIASETARDLRRRAGPKGETRTENLQKLESGVDEADAEISATSQEFLDLRARVVRISIDTDNARRADAFNASLDELNARLEALGDVSSPGQ